MSIIPFRRFTPEHAEAIGRAVEAAMIGHQGYMMRADEAYDEYLERIFEPRTCDCDNPDCNSREKPTIMSDIGHAVASRNVADQKLNFAPKPIARASMIRDCYEAAELLKVNSHNAGGFMLIIVGEQGDDLMTGHSLGASGAAVFSANMGSLHHLAVERVMEKILADSE